MLVVVKGRGREEEKVRALVAQKMGAGSIRVSNMNRTKINIYGLDAKTTKKELKAAITKEGGGRKPTV